MISVSFIVVKEDVVALACHYYETSSMMKRTCMAVQVGLALVFGGLGVLIFLAFEDVRAFGVTLLVSAVIVPALFPKLYRAQLRRSAQRFAAESSYERTFGKYSLSVSEEGLAATSPISESKLRWEAVTRVSLTPEYLFIFLAGPSGWAISRAQVPDSTIFAMKDFIEPRIRST